MEPKRFIENLKIIDFVKYKDLDGDRLIVYVVHILEKNKIAPRFDDIVIAAFKLFPERFSLISYNVPDAKKVHDCLWHCTYKTKVWLGGKTKHGFYLTDLGKKIATIVESRLASPSSEKVVGEDVILKHKTGRQEKSILGELIKSDAYVAFKKGLRTIDEYDLRRALRGIRTTSKTNLLVNYGKLKIYATELKQTEILEFLEFVKKNLLDKLKE
jgi:hypothetical protein